MTDWDHDVDVVVLGSGGAGLTAALTAAVNGASVEVYERPPPSAERPRCRAASCGYLRTTGRPTASS